MNSITKRLPHRHLAQTYVVPEPYSRRLKIYNPRIDDDSHAWISPFLSLGVQRGCDKIIFYMQENEGHLLTDHFHLEAKIKGFFDGQDAYIYASFLHPLRNLPIDESKESYVLKTALNDSKQHRSLLPLPVNYLMRTPNQHDAESMAALYRTVFQTYPTPMHDPNFIRDIMQQQVYFTVVEHKGQIVSACSADVMPPYLSAEMSDCATHADHRGQGLLSHPFTHLSTKMQNMGIKTLFSYSRSLSMGMNLINKRQGFIYGGKMVQNSNISGRLESMNVWYKDIYNH